MKIDIEKLICFLISDEVIENNIPESLKLGLKEQGYKYEDGKICPLQEEPVSENLEEASKEWLRPQLDKSYANYGETKMMELTRFDGYAILDAIEFGAQWQKEHLWKTADGENLPELERDVVVLVDNFGKLIPKLAKRTYHLIENFVDEDTGEIISMEHTYKVGDVINWTEPAIYWLDVDLPKLQED